MRYIDKETGEIKMFIRTPYNYDTDAVSESTGLTCNDESKTQQQFKDEVDINTIVERFNASGEGPPTMQFPQQEEFMDAFDFQTSMNVLVKGREAFMELPAKARARFQNDPQQFMEFIHNPENQDEALKLKLIVKREEPEQPTVKQDVKPAEPVKEK